MKKLKWYINRAKAMSVLEIVYRIKILFHNKILKYKYFNKKISVFKVKNYIEDKNLLDIEKSLKNIFKDISITSFENDFSYKIYEDYINLTKDIQWDKSTIGNWDNTKFCKDYNFKDSEYIGEIRYTWEINRCHFMVQLALDYKINKKKKSLELIKKHFYDWNDKNPFLIGVNWNSSMEIAIRAYQWLVVYFLILEDSDKKFKHDLMNAIINSIKYVSENLSLFSSANNHLIVESAICGIIGSVIKPLYNQEWLKKSSDRLSKELDKQVFDDGVDKEQSVHYHAFVLEMILQYNLILNNLGVKGVRDDITYKMCEFLRYIVFDSGECMSEFGDSDNGYIINFGNSIKNYYEYVLALASVYFNIKFINHIGMLEVKLFSNKNYIADEYKVKMVKIFKEGGYIVVRNKFNLIFDFGELGFGKIKAHGHADGANIIVYYGNKPIVIDPGTYIYNCNDYWRNYFRSTEMHNTLNIDGKSQAQIGGPFLWNTSYQCKLGYYKESDELIKISVSNDAYKNISIYTRNLYYFKNKDILVIEDCLDNGVGEITYVLDSTVDMDKVNKRTIRINGIFITSNVEYSLKDIFISKSFLNKVKSKKISITNDYLNNKHVYTVFSSEKVKLTNNEVILEDNSKLILN